MNNRKFERAAKARKRQAVIFAILIHGAIIGGVMYESGTSNQLIEKVQQLWKGETVKELPKAEKKRA